MTEQILTSNPFKQSPLVTEGDTNIREIYWRMGYAIHRFNVCETEFAYLYNRLTNPSAEGLVLLRSFGTIVSATTKRQVIEEAAATYFRQHKALDAPIAKRIAKLLEMYKYAASRRNEVAHGGVYASRKMFLGSNKPSTSEWFLTPVPTATNKRDPLSFGPTDPMTYRYNSVELEKLSDNFQLLENSIAKAMNDLRDFALALPQENSGQQK